MAMPYAGLLAGAGATQGFEQLLARRLEAEKFQEMQRQAKAHEELQNRTLAETAKNREEQTAMRYWMQDQAHQDRQAVLEEKNRAATEGEKMKRISLALGQPIGSQVGVSEAQGQMKAGVPSSMYEYHPGTFGSEGLVPAGAGKPPVMTTTPGQPEGYTFQGGEASRLKREHEAGINSRDEENRLLKVSLEQMREAAKLGDARRGQFVPNAQGGIMFANPYNGTMVPATGPGGQQVQPESSAERLVQQHRDQILPTVRRLKELSTQIQTSSGPRQMLSGVKQYVGAKANLNPVADEYMRLRGATALALSAIANQGRPTEPDRQALEAILPGLGTRKDVADNLWKSVERVLANPRKFGNIASITSELQGGTGDQPAAGSFKVGDFTFQPK